MDVLDRNKALAAEAETADAQRRLDAAALWSAIRADWRASDERTARLRAMQLAAGEGTTT